MQININELSTLITTTQDFKDVGNVQKIKELINKTMFEISNYQDEEILDFINRYRQMRKLNLKM